MIELPAGPLGVAIKAAVGLVIAAIWTSTPGAEEARSVASSPWTASWRGPGAAPCACSAAARCRATAHTAIHAQPTSPTPRRIPCRIPQPSASPIAQLTRSPRPHHRSGFKAQTEKRQGYSRHYAFKGRHRKEQLLADAKEEYTALTPARS
jgi:hypothetical protein